MIHRLTTIFLWLFLSISFTHCRCQTKEKNNNVYISQSNIGGSSGRGVFAAKSIRSGEVIEVCPVVEIARADVGFIRKTDLVHYYFYWGKELKGGAIALGFGSLYNHSYAPNATYKKDYENKTIEFIALRNISEGEEVTINYNYGDPNDKSPWQEEKDKD